MAKHLDIMDPRRRDLFADAECQDCEFFAGFSKVSWTCDAEAFVRLQLVSDMLEANPDAMVPGIRIMPNSDDKAARCPGFNPSREYLEELERIEADAAQTCRRDGEACISAPTIIPTPLFDEYRRQCGEAFRLELERALEDGCVTGEAKGSAALAAVGMPIEREVRALQKLLFDNDATLTISSGGKSVTIGKKAA